MATADFFWKLEIIFPLNKATVFLASPTIDLALHRQFPECGTGIVLREVSTLEEFPQGPNPEPVHTPVSSRQLIGVSPFFDYKIPIDKRHRVAAGQAEPEIIVFTGR